MKRLLGVFVYDFGQLRVQLHVLARCLRLRVVLLLDLVDGLLGGRLALVSGGREWLGQFLFLLLVLGVDELELLLGAFFFQAQNLYLLAQILHLLRLSLLLVFQLPLEAVDLALVFVLQLLFQLQDFASLELLHLLEPLPFLLQLLLQSLLPLSESLDSQLLVSNLSLQRT